MSRPSISKEQIDRAIQVAIDNLRHGIPVRTTAIQTGIHYQRLYRALRHNLDAYVARCEYLTTGHLAPKRENDAFWRRMRLERLVTYRRLNGMPPNPSPKRKVDPNDPNDQSNQRVK